MTSKLANNLSRSASINIRSSKYESDTPITHIRSNSNPQTLWNTPSKRPATVVITGQSQDCFVCHLPVYPAEQCLVDSYSLHPNCFRCRHCNQLLSLSTNEKLDAYFYCKAHYKLYTHNNELIRSNPLLANASYSQSISLAVEAQEALGKSISGKKAAYESLVKASTTTVLDLALNSSFKLLKENSSLSLKGSLKKANSLEKSKSFLNFKSMSKSSNSKDSADISNDNKDIKVIETSFPVSKIVQNCLNIYEAKNQSLSKVTTTSTKTQSSFQVKRSFSSEVSKSNVTSISTKEKSYYPLSRSKTSIVTKSNIDPSLNACQNTTLQSRILNFQTKNECLPTTTTTMTTTTNAINLNSGMNNNNNNINNINNNINNIKKNKVLKETKFQSAIEKFSLLDENNNNNNQPPQSSRQPQYRSINRSNSLLETNNNSNSKLNSIIPSDSIKLISTLNKPSRILVNGLFCYKNISDDSDLKEIISQINRLMPSLIVKKNIEIAINNLDQKLKDKDDYIEKLHVQVGILETKLNALIFNS